jgi:ADP-heptose:LPS heptosyltransferase
MARSSDVERAFDRTAGSAAVFLVGLLRRRREWPAAPHRVGVIQPTAIGDVVLMSGLLRHLRHMLPGVELHVFHGPSNAAALPLLPADVVGHCCAFKRPWRTLAALRGARLDVLINCAPWTRLTALLTALAGAHAMGFRSAGQYTYPAYDVAVPYSPTRHEVENHRALAELFGPLDEYRPSVRLPDRSPGVVPAVPASRLVLMHVTAGGSRAREKSWPAANWAMLARRVADQGWVVGFTGAAEDEAAVRQIADAARVAPDRCFSLAGRLSLPDLAALLARVRLLVSIDTGIAHLAAAVGGQVIGLHGPTRFERWGARNDRSIGLNAPHPAAGYIHFGFEKHPQGDRIMATLSVDAVAAAVFSRLGHAGPLVSDGSTPARQTGETPEPVPLGLFEEI